MGEEGVGRILLMSQSDRDGSVVLVKESEGIVHESYAFVHVVCMETNSWGTLTC